MNDWSNLKTVSFFCLSFLIAGLLYPAAVLSENCYSQTLNLKCIKRAGHLQLLRNASTINMAFKVT